ncbi:unnamed protein product [Cochlearia groenlandica]
MNHHHYDDVAPRHSPKKRRSFDNTTPEYEAMGTHHYNDVASSDSPSDQPPKTIKSPMVTPRMRLRPISLVRLS